MIFQKKSRSKFLSRKWEKNFFFVQTWVFLGKEKSFFLEKILQSITAKKKFFLSLLSVDLMTSLTTRVVKLFFEKWMLIFGSIMCVYQRDIHLKACDISKKTKVNDKIYIIGATNIRIIYKQFGSNHRNFMRLMDWQLKWLALAFNLCQNNILTGFDIVLGRLDVFYIISSQFYTIIPFISRANS